MISSRTLSYCLPAKPRLSRLLCFQRFKNSRGKGMTQPEGNAILPVEGYLTTEDGVRLFFQKVGNGPQTVLIPNGMHLLGDFKRFAAGRTLIFYDLRNRGRSDQVTDDCKLKRGIHHDVDDLETVRRHFGASQPALIGHSYVGLTVVLYAMKYPDH